jgi:diacylglycerol kinase (ATP)
MEARKVALLVNTKAGKGLAAAIAAAVCQQLENARIATTLYADNWPSSLEAYTDAWIFGGDGTLNYFINRYPSATVALSVFKAGTGNDFASILYGHRSVSDQVDFVLQCPPRPVDAGSCNEKLFLGSVGIGFDGAVLQRMHQIRKIGGHAGYLLEVVRQIVVFRERSFRIHSRKLLFDQPLLLVMVHNSSRTGGGFLVSPLSSVNDGLLDLITCQPLSVWKRLKYLPAIQKGRHLSLPFVQHHTGESFTIECATELPAQCDGELMVASRFTFHVLKDRFLFRY